jgi:limonene-1,2-epoxide hydrolase
VDVVCPAECQHNRPQEEPDGEPDRGSAQVLRGVVRVINIAANGPVVMTERLDVFRLPGKSFELQVMGTFEVSDGKIHAWRDYFDQNQFTSRMG